MKNIEYLSKEELRIKLEDLIRIFNEERQKNNIFELKFSEKCGRLISLNKTNLEIFQKHILYNYFTDFQEFCYWIKNSERENFIEEMFCNVCGNLAKWYRFSDGYRNICSDECYNKNITNNLNNYYQRRTEEERISKSNKLKEKHKDLDFQKKRTENLKKALKERNLEDTKKAIENNRKSILSFYRERETEEHKNNRKLTLKESMKKYFSTESEEHKKARIEKASTTLKNKSPEEKQKSKKKYQETIAKRTFEQKQKSLEQALQTRKERGSLRESKAEKEIRDFIESLGIKTCKEICGKNENRFEIDIFIPEKNIGIEYNGSYWHNVKMKSRSYHYTKSKVAESKGIELIHIWEDQWINQNNLIKTILMSRLGILDNSERIYARQCEIKEIDNSLYKDFVSKNHIQGYKNASIRLGLFHKNKLVQIASFNKVRNTGRASSQNSKYEYEWVRGCPASNNIVVGGTSKLFKYFIKTYNPNSILCYADWNLFNGRGYKECGFEFVGYTGPDKFYITNNSSHSRINRNPYKYKEFKDLVEQNKLFECYGAGSLKFEWKN